MNNLKEEKKQELLNILLSNYRFHTPSYNLEKFIIDLIIVVDIPTWPNKILKKQIMPLKIMRKKVTPHLSEAYKRALQKIQNTTDQNNEVNIYLNHTGGFQKQQEDEENVNNFQTEEQVLRNLYQSTPDKTLFTLNLNMLIYSLQKDCGFNVQKFVINDKIFLLINCQQQNLMKAAVVHKIKKQIIYSQVDIYLNEPLDSKNRPIFLNKQFKLQRIMDVQKKKQQQKTEQRLIQQKERSNIIQQDRSQVKQSLMMRPKLKKYHRKLGNVQNYTNQIIGEVKLSQSEKSKFKDYMNQYTLILNQLNSKIQDFGISQHQQDYLQKILGQKNTNGLALKVFKEIKRKEKYFQNVTNLVSQSNYRVFEPSVIYTPFFMLNKKKKYQDRMRSLFMFKPLITGQKGQLDLFLRMERTRLSYLILLEYFRIQNFPIYGFQFFTLHNSFEKNGKSSEVDQIKGGLDGHNLQKSWSVFTPWKSDIKIIRDYLGQSIAYFTFLKNKLILALMIFSPIALLAFLIILLVLPLNLTSNSHLDTFVFYTAYAFIILIWLSAYTINQDQQQAFHFGTLKQTSLKKTPNFGYKSPYVRNLISDSVNQFMEIKSVFNRVKQFLGLIFVIVLLGFDVAIFYGIRRWSLTLLSQVSPSKLFFQWYQFIPIFLFYMGNHLVYTFGLKKLFAKITSLQNNPNLQKNQSSTQVKCLVFRIGVELIGPIDLMVVEALGTHNCYDSSCWNAYTSFINIRFIVIFIILLIRFLIFLVEHLINKVRVKKESQKQLKTSTYRISQSKIAKIFIKIMKQYAKKEHKVNIQEELIILVQLSLFSVIQPINILINLLNILLDFYLQRIEILHGCRRPINTATSTPDYSILIKVPFYIFCSFNSWMLLVNFQDLQYVSPAFYEAFLNVPTKDTLTTLKIILALGLFCGMFLFEYLFRKIYMSYSSYGQIIIRKQRKLADYLYKYQKMKVGASNDNIKPIVHIGRIKFF